jgi:hypothetical protein
MLLTPHNNQRNQAVSKTLLSIIDVLLLVLFHQKTPPYHQLNHNSKILQSFDQRRR